MEVKALSGLIPSSAPSAPPPPFVPSNRLQPNPRVEELQEAPQARPSFTTDNGVPVVLNGTFSLHLSYSPLIFMLLSSPPGNLTISGDWMLCFA